MSQILYYQDGITFFHLSHGYEHSLCSAGAQTGIQQIVPDQQRETGRGH